MAEGVSQTDKGISFFIWFSLFLAAGAFFFVLLTSTSREYQKVAAKHDEVAKRHARATQKTETLKKEIEGLENDPVAIEREARKSLNYARPGEVTYKRENIPLIPPASASTQQSKRRRLSMFIQRELKDWQVPLIVFGVIVTALLILRLFATNDDKVTAEEH